MRRNKLTRSSYHQPGKAGDYRNVAIPVQLHKRLAHIAIDSEFSASELVTALVEEFCERWDKGETQMQSWDGGHINTQQYDDHHK